MPFMVILYSQRERITVNFSISAPFPSAYSAFYAILWNFPLWNTVNPHFLIHNHAKAELSIFLSDK